MRALLRIMFFCIVGLAVATPVLAASIKKKDGRIVEGDIEDLVVLLRDSPSDKLVTYLLIKGLEVSSLDARGIQPSGADSMHLLIVIDYGKHPDEHAKILERFLKHSGPGEIHMLLDLPGEIAAVDLHRPQSMTNIELKGMVKQWNLAAFAKVKYGDDRGEALYSRLYDEHQSLQAGARLTGTVLGTIGSDNKLVESLSLSTAEGVVTIPVGALAQ